MKQRQTIDWRDDPLVRVQKIFIELLPLAMDCVDGGRDSETAFETHLKSCLRQIEVDGLEAMKRIGVTSNADQAADLRTLAERLREEAKQFRAADTADAAALWQAARRMDVTLESALDVMREIFLTQIIEGQRDVLQAVQAASHDIDSISRQIHFISINASIEAARVGQSGRGFSIIAQEIRDLAAEVSAVLARLSDDARKAS